MGKKYSSSGIELTISLSEELETFHPTTGVAVAHYGIIDKRFLILVVGGA